MVEGREHEAVANARQRLELQKQAVGERHPDYATGLNQLALLLIMHGDPDRAEPLLRQALEIRKDTLGESHPDYATNLSSLAGLLWARGDLDGAEPLLRQALEIRWQMLGSSHPKSIASLNSLEQLLRAKQDWDGIERLTASTAQGHPPGGSAVEATRPPTPPPAAAPAPAAAPPAPAPAASAPAKPAAEKPAPPPAQPAPARPVAQPAPAKPPAPPAPAKAATGRPAQPAAAAAPPRSQPEAKPKPAPAPPAAAAEKPKPAPAPAAAPRPEQRPAPAAAKREPAPAGDASREELARRRERLASDFAEVGERLKGEAEDWKSGGAPPSERLIDELGRCSRDFDRLRDEVIRHAGSLGMPIEPSGVANLHEMGTLLQTLEELEGRHAELEAVREDALDVLDRVLALAHPDQKEFAPLVACQAKARERRAAIAEAPVRELPDDAVTIAEGEDPYSALLTLVEGDNLDDDLWASSLETVESEFGKPLSVAVARSKIVSPATA